MSLTENAYGFSFGSNRALCTAFSTLALLSDFTLTSGSSQFSTMTFRPSSTAIALFASYTSFTIRSRITGLARLAWRSNITLISFRNQPAKKESKFVFPSATSL